MKRTDRLGALAGNARLEQADDALLLLAGAQQQDVGLALLVDIELVARHQRQAAPGEEREPNSVTVGGGTPRRVHSRPKAAMARGWARKNAGSFHTLVISSSRSSGVGAPVRVLIF
jgi:hypothetical protein